MTEEEKILKFGQAIVNKIRIIDHNCKRNLVYLGWTQFGTPVYINRDVAESDFAIGIGGIYPAKTSGFSGGAKLILGVCGLKTIRFFHFRRSGVQRGGSLESKFRQDLLEAAKLAGLKFIINNLLSQDREIINVFAGDLQDAHSAGVKKARKIYSVPNPRKLQLDLVIADSYPFDTNGVFTRKGWWSLKQCKPDCHRLLISAIHAGIGDHGLFPLIPHKHQKLIDFMVQMQIRSVSQKARWLVRKFTQQRRVQNKNGKTAHKHPIMFFHSLDRNPYLTNRNVQFINNLTEHFQHLLKEMNGPEVKVGFYRGSSLTYPV